MILNNTRYKVFCKNIKLVVGHNVVFYQTTIFIRNFFFNRPTKRKTQHVKKSFCYVSDNLKSLFHNILKYLCLFLFTNTTTCSTRKNLLIPILTKYFQITTGSVRKSIRKQISLFSQ